MSKMILVARILLGLAFLVFGLNGFLHFFAPPPPGDEHAAALGKALNDSGYIFQIMSFFEVVAAVLLLAGRAVPLALAFLAPILINIVAFHLFLEMTGIGLGVFLTILEVFLAWSFRAAFAPMFSATTPKAA